LRTRNSERTLEIGFGFGRVPFGQHQRDLAGRAMDLGFTPPFIGRVRYRYRFVSTAPSIIELVKLRMRLR
jgi:hypothetical protein